MTTELRELMTSAADDQPPHDLAGRAMSGARRRRQGRLAVLGSAAAVTALVAGAVVLGPLQPTSDEPRPQDVASLPSELPPPDGLPELTSGAMDAASVAYVVDDRLVLVDAATARVAVWNPFPEGLDIGSDKVNAALPHQVRLSPDGTSALVAMRFETSQRLLGIRLVLLDVPSAQLTPIEDLQLSDAYAQSAWLEYNLMAWAPDGKTAYCVCLGGDRTDPEIGVWEVTVGDAPEGAFYSRITDLVPTQISAGAAGLAVQLEPGGDWAFMSEGQLQDYLGPAESLSLSPAQPTGFASVTDGWYAVQDVREKVDWRRPPAGPVSSLHAFVSDYVLVSWPKDAAPGEPPPPQPLVAHSVSRGGAPKFVATFPAGSSSTSFAAGIDATP